MNGQGNIEDADRGLFVGPMKVNLKRDPNPLDAYCYVESLLRFKREFDAAIPLRKLNTSSDANRRVEKSLAPTYDTLFGFHVDTRRQHNSDRPQAGAFVATAITRRYNSRSKKTPSVWV